MDWKDRQFETLEKICQGHGIERVSMDNHSRHMSVESYKKEQRMIESLQNNLEHALKTQNLPVTEQIEPHVNRITKKKTVPYNEYLALLEHDKEQSDKISTLEKQIALQKAQISSLTNEKEKYKRDYLNTKKKAYIEENRRLEARVERLENINDSLSYKLGIQEERLKETEKDRDAVSYTHLDVYKRQDELLYETQEEIKAYQTKEREKNIARQQERGMSR